MKMLGCVVVLAMVLASSLVYADGEKDVLQALGKLGAIVEQLDKEAAIKSTDHLEEFNALLADAKSEVDMYKVLHSDPAFEAQAVLALEAYEKVAGSWKVYLLTVESVEASDKEEEERKELLEYKEHSESYMKNLYDVCKKTTCN